MELEGCGANCCGCQTLIRPPLYTRDAEILWMKSGMRKQSASIHGGLLSLFDVLVPFRKCLINTLSPTSTTCAVNTSRTCLCGLFKLSRAERDPGCACFTSDFQFQAGSTNSIWKKKKKQKQHTPENDLCISSEAWLLVIKGGFFPWSHYESFGSPWRQQYYILLFCFSSSPHWQVSDWHLHHDSQQSDRLNSV